MLGVVSVYCADIRREEGVCVGQLACHLYPRCCEGDEEDWWQSVLSRIGFVVFNLKARGLGRGAHVEIVELNI